MTITEEERDITWQIVDGINVMFVLKTLQDWILKNCLLIVYNSTCSLTDVHGLKFACVLDQTGTWKDLITIVIFFLCIARIT